MLRRAACACILSKLGPGGWFTGSPLNAERKRLGEAVRDLSSSYYSDMFTAVSKIHWSSANFAFFFFFTQLVLFSQAVYGIKKFGTEAPSPLLDLGGSKKKARREAAGEAGGLLTWHSGQP